MARPEEIEGYEVPLHIALTQPILMGGAPRTFAILNGTLALVIGMGLHLWWLGFPAGAALHAAAALMSKRDPHWFDIFRRHVRQPPALRVRHRAGFLFTKGMAQKAAGPPKRQGSRRLLTRMRARPPNRRRMGF